MSSGWRRRPRSGDPSTDAPGFYDGLPPPRVEPTPRWVRVRAGDWLIADSRRALLLAWYGPGRLPTYCFPAPDVRVELLHPSATASVPYGSAHDIRTDGVVLEAAARLLDDLPQELAAARDHWTFTWDGGVTWLEEALAIAVHARDPSKRVDAVPSEREVVVELAGEVVARSRRAHALFETTLPTRWYLPPEDVRQELLEPSQTTSRCPYKGTARYWSVRANGELFEDVAWSYPQPVPECPRIAHLVCFFNEKVDLTIDGERLERPLTPWSPAR